MDKGEKTWMKIVPLDSKLEPVFLNHVNQDVSHHHFFILDWKFNRDSTKILLALEQNKIQGMMLVYRESIVQFRGSITAVKALLKHLDIEKAEIQALKEHAPLILKKYRPTMCHEMILMTLGKGEERPCVKHPVVRLGAEDAEQIATLMAQADPEWWGTTTAQQIMEGMKERLWLGIKVDGKLVSLGNTRFTEWGSNIGVVATEEAHRNKGYATSIVSALVKQILEKSPIALIHVLSDNPPAIRVYTKVGFKPYSTYFVMRGEKR